MTKGTYKDAAGNITLNGKTTESFSFETRDKMKRSVLFTSIQHCTRRSSVIRQEIKGIQIGKKEIMLWVFTRDGVVYIGDLTSAEKY